MVSGVSTDTTKYHQVIASLEPQYLVHIADIIRNPPVLNKYEAIKTALITEYADSDQRKLSKLIREIQLGDLKPSQLLKRMKDLAGNKIADEALKSLWLERLPENVRTIISIVDGDSYKMSLQADKIMEVQTYANVSEIKANPSNSSLRDEIEKLREEIRQLKTGRQQRNRSRSKSRPNTRFPFCKYHYKFGDKAKKCTEPCEYKKLKTGN